MKNLLKAIGSIFFCELVGLAATPFTVSSIPTWYAGLNKPPFSPPNWVFGPVWTALYALMGISLFLILKQGVKNKEEKTAVYYFLIQLLFNFLWSFIFFGLHKPLLAFIDILLMLLVIVFTMLKFRQISKPAFYLLIPYLLWVSFASILNLSIVLLNR